MTKVLKHTVKADKHGVNYLGKKFTMVPKGTIKRIVQECGNDLKLAKAQLKKEKKRLARQEDNDFEVPVMKKQRKAEPKKSPTPTVPDSNGSSLDDSFAPPDDRIEESESLEVNGEHDDGSDEKKGGLPMRTLDNFCLFDLSNNNQFANIDDIGKEGTDIVAFGDVGAIFVDDADEEDDDEENDDDAPSAPVTSNVQLSSIFVWQVHLNDDVPELWLLTMYGWYKLLKPMDEYASLYMPIFARTMIAGMAEAELADNPKISYKKFLQKVEITPNTLDLIITSDDVEQNADYIHQELCAWADEVEFDASKSPLMKKLGTMQGSAVEYVPSIGQVVRGEAKRSPAAKDVTSEPCVTSHIASVSKDMFVRKLIEIKSAAEKVEKDVQAHKHPEKSIYKQKTKEINWQGEPLFEEGYRTYYGSVAVDGESISVGDCVYLRTQDGEEPWFARVVSLFQEDDDQMFHARFFSHGKETVLMELAAERELFLLDNCADNYLDSVMGKCNIQHMGVDEYEPAVFPSTNYWYYRLWYDPEFAVFEDSQLHEGTESACLSCINTQAIRTQDQVVFNDDKTMFRTHREDYHIHDFAYLLTGEENEPYEIGQIVEITDTNVKVQILKRQDTDMLDHNNMVIKPQDEPYKDYRLLTFTDDIKTVEFVELEGTCWVELKSNISDIPAYKRNPNNFYVEELKNQRCDKCLEAREKHQRATDDYMQNGKKLVALDIFGGCGGLTCGMDMTNVVETRYAVEFNSSAAVTFERNFPEATVYNKCANLLLRRAIAQHSHGETLDEIDDELGRPLKDMPKPGDVDYIYCGPPCQGFSLMNRFKKADEIKNTLVCTALSYVDFYKPKYFLLENVRGLIIHKLGVEQEINNGVLKYILRCLTSMGYQVRFGLHQAANQGVAQSRRRLFVWGARIGNKLPDFPAPANCFDSRAGVTINVGDDHTISYSTRTGNRAPLPAVTVGDTISDLPGFEYENTHHVIPDNAEYAKIRRETVVKQLPATHEIVGQEKQAYPNPPKTDFQSFIRNGADTLHNHVTRSFTPVNVERVYNIAMKPGADHRSLPDSLEPYFLSAKNPATIRYKHWAGRVGRLDFNGRFQTQLTQMEPMGKNGTVIHPNQRRVLTVREAARVQGFPDTFVFDSAAEKKSVRIRDMYKQIGNAVPVPLSLSLGNELREALVTDWEKRM